MSDAPNRRGFQFGLTDLLMVTAAVGLSLTLLTAAKGILKPQMIVFLLYAFTAAAGGLLRGRRHAWPMAFLLAPLLGAVVLALGIILELVFGSGSV